MNTEQKIAHTWCVEKAGETVVMLGPSDDYDPNNNEIHWLLQNAQPNWPCSICGGSLDSGPNDPGFDPNYRDGKARPTS
jgi:hypothetical protein